MRFPYLRGPGIWPWLALLAAGFLAGGRLGAGIVAVTGIAGVLAVGAALAPGRDPQADLRRILPPDPPTAGDDVEVRLEGRLSLGWPLALVRLADEPPPPLQGTSGPWLLGGNLSVAYTLRAVPRGVYRFRRCQATLRDGLGLIERSIDLALPGQLVVYPARVALPAPARQVQAFGSEEVARGTRDFLPGDRPSRLHAARTAQRGYPQVRESTPPPEQARTLQIYCPDASAGDIELAISVAASLAEALLGSGLRVGLCLKDASLPPAHGPEQRSRILLALSRASAADLAGAKGPPPLPDGHGEPWLILGGSAALRPDPPAAGTVLRVGAQLGRGAVTSLDDLAVWAGRAES